MTSEINVGAGRIARWPDQQPQLGVCEHGPHQGFRGLRFRLTVAYLPDERLHTGENHRTLMIDQLRRATKPSSSAQHRINDSFLHQVLLAFKDTLRHPQAGAGPSAAGPLRSAPIPPARRAGAVGAYCSRSVRGVPFGWHPKGRMWLVPQTLAAWERQGRGRRQQCRGGGPGRHRACRRREPMPLPKKALTAVGGMHVKSRIILAVAAVLGIALAIAPAALRAPRAGAAVQGLSIHGLNRIQRAHLSGFASFEAGLGVPTAAPAGPGRCPDEQRRGEPVPAELRAQRPGQPELPERHRPGPAGPRPGPERDHHRAEPVQPAPGGGRVQRLPAR